MEYRLEQIIGPNDPCICGSGKAYKECCASKMRERFSPDVRFLAPDSIQRLEPHVHVVPSVIFNGKRVRAIWSKVYFRPQEETFHEFLIRVLTWTFGEGWHREELAKSLPHVVYKWYQAYLKFRKDFERPENFDGIHWGASPTGRVQALISLAYDLFILQQVNKLPGFLIRRLRNKNEFQGARYEIEVAAIMARAGFEIEYLDNKIKAEKHCEFIATHKKTGIKVGIEAKSRRRPGVLHELGLFDPTKNIKGDVESLFKRAKKQKPERVAFIIFLDLNVPPSRQAPFFQKPWGEGVKQMLSKDGAPTKEKPDPYNALILTNHAYHFFEDQRSGGGEYGVVIPMFSEILLPEQILNDVLASVERYGRIPREA